MKTSGAPFLTLRALLCCALAALCCLLPLAVTHAGTLLPNGVVALCFDGDTLKLTDRRVVRLAGIDTPEVSHGGQPSQYYAREAADRLTALSRGQQVQLVAVTDQSKDRYGRLVADVRLPDGTSLSDTLVGEGAAYVYPHKDLDPELADRLLVLQRAAITARRGMWGRILGLPAARATYMGNRQSRRFFPADDVYAQRIKPRNRVMFGNLMDAFMAGYAPARPCPYWPAVR